MRPTQIIRQACRPSHRLTKNTLLALLEPDSQTYKMLQKAGTNNWTVTSFNPANRTVCVRIDSKYDLFGPSVSTTVSITLPALA